MLHRTRPPVRPLLPMRFDPQPGEVDDLIRRAEVHPLGTDFLREGALDAVAATFGAHAFTVLGARERLTGAGRRGRA